MLEPEFFLKPVQVFFRILYRKGAFFLENSYRIIMNFKSRKLKNWGKKIIKKNNEKLKFINKKNLN